MYDPDSVADEEICGLMIVLIILVNDSVPPLYRHRIYIIALASCPRPENVLFHEMVIIVGRFMSCWSAHQLSLPSIRRF